MYEIRRISYLEQNGGVAERLNALVLKTSILYGIGGSNPSSSAENLYDSK